MLNPEEIPDNIIEGNSQGIVLDKPKVATPESAESAESAPGEPEAVKQGLRQQINETVINFLEAAVATIDPGDSKFGTVALHLGLTGMLLGAASLFNQTGGEPWLIAAGGVLEIAGIVIPKLTQNEKSQKEKALRESIIGN